MKHAVYLPVFGDFADARVLARLAADAEQAGWDGVFIWDHLATWFDPSAPVVDATVALAAIAAATRQVRFGALVTPLARRRPAKFARETTSLDVLSGGRLIVGVGLGDNRHEFEAFGEEPDPRQRGDALDEALDVVNALWTGEQVQHTGERFRVVEARFLPRPVQQPRIPIWVAGAWPHRRPFRRAARYDGVVPMVAEPGPFDTPVETVAELLAFIRHHRSPSAPFDVAQVTGNPDLDPARRAAAARRYEAVGVTWWLEDVDPWRFEAEPDGPWPLKAMGAFIAGGPARA